MEAMNRRQRLIATLRGEPVDRPAVSFYELNGLDENCEDTDPFNIYSHPSWRPLLELTRTRTDRIVMRGVGFDAIDPDPIENIAETETHIRDGSRLTVSRVRAGVRTLTTRTRRDLDVNTVWTEEHLLKDVDDLKAFCQTTPPPTDVDLNTTSVTRAEDELGDSGIVMIDTPDPLCLAASLFDMASYTITAMTEPVLFGRLLDHFAPSVLARTEQVARALPGRLWRIYGPEYAAPPFLPPELFSEYVCRHVKPMIDAIHRGGGYARIHSHGNLRAILDDIAAMGADAIDPIEPPPQGDVELSYVREKYGKNIVLFGNLEIADIENMPTDQFAEKVKRALDEGTADDARGFVLMPSASPYGRELAPLTMKNYETIVELVEAF
jgi:uroporphyrinogen-III decarboxylase